jgi:hypothetical protein
LQWLRIPRGRKDILWYVHVRVGGLALIRNNSGLQTFAMGQVRAADPILVELCQNCPHLEELGIFQLDGDITEASLYNLLRQCKNLRCIDLKSCSIASTAYQPPATISMSMRSIAFEDVSISDKELEELLRACPALTSLALTKCGALLHLESMRYSTLCPCLEQLSLCANGSTVEDFTLMGISRHCPALRILQIADSSEVTDAALIAIAENCPLLEFLDCTGCPKVTDVLLTVLAQRCRALHTLGLALCPKVTVAGVDAVRQGCPKLTDVDEPSSGPTVEAL